MFALGGIAAVLIMRTIVLPAQFRVWRAGFDHRQSGAGGLEFGVAAVAEGAVGAVLASAEVHGLGLDG